MKILDNSVIKTCDRCINCYIKNRTKEISSLKQQLSTARQLLESAKELIVKFTECNKVDKYGACNYQNHIDTVKWLSDFAKLNELGGK